MSLVTTIKGFGKGVATFCKANSPEILLGVGFVGIGAGIGLTVRATLKAKDRYDEQIDEECEICDDMTPDNEEACGRMLIAGRVKTGLHIALDYAPAVICTAGGVAAIIASHNIQARRIAVISAGYNTLLATFNEYRRKVEEDHGVEYSDKTFKEIKEKQLEERRKLANLQNATDEEVLAALGLDPNDDCSDVTWDADTSYNWSKYTSDNVAFLTNMQNVANNQLQVDRILLKADVLKNLGMDPRQYPMSYVTGWVYDGTPGSDVVDFGIHQEMDVFPEHASEVTDSSWILHFNDHGVILRDLANFPGNRPGRKASRA